LRKCQGNIKKTSRKCNGNVKKTSRAVSVELGERHPNSLVSLFTRGLDRFFDAARVGRLKINLAKLW